MMRRPAGRFLTMPFPPLPFAARRFAAVIRPPRLFLAMDPVRISRTLSFCCSSSARIGGSVGLNISERTSSVLRGPHQSRAPDRIRSTDKAPKPPGCPEPGRARPSGLIAVRRCGADDSSGIADPSPAARWNRRLATAWSGAVAARWELDCRRLPAWTWGSCVSRTDRRYLWVGGRPTLPRGQDAARRGLVKKSPNWYYPSFIVGSTGVELSDSSESRVHCSLHQRASIPPLDA
jgi:hypothetical protein